MQAGVVGNSRHQPHADVGAGHVEPVGDRRAAGGAGRQPAPGAAGPAARRSHRRLSPPRAGRAPGAGAQRRRRGAGPASSCSASSTPAPAISRQPSRCSTALRRRDAGRSEIFARRRDRRPGRGRHHGRVVDRTGDTRPPSPRPLPTIADASIRRPLGRAAPMQRARPRRMPKIRIASRSGRRTASASSAGRRGRCRHERRPGACRAGRPLRKARCAMNNVGVIDRFLDDLHPLHRLRLRPARRRGRLPRHDADRHRHHAGRPVLGLGRRRGHHRRAW